MDLFGRWLVVVGLGIAVVGGLVWVAGHFGLPLGRLPGDLRIERDGFRFYLPLGTCLALSALLTLVMWIVGRLR